MAELQLTVNTTAAVRSITALENAMNSAASKASALSAALDNIRVKGLDQAINDAISKAEKKVQSKQVKVQAKLHIDIDRDLAAIQAVLSARPPLVIPAVLRVVGQGAPVGVAEAAAAIKQQASAGSAAAAAAARSRAMDMAIIQQAAIRMNQTALGKRFSQADIERFQRNVQNMLPWLQINPAQLTQKQMAEGQMAAWLLRWQGLKHPVRAVVGTQPLVEGVGGAGALSLFRKQGFQGTLMFTPGGARALTAHELAHMVQRMLLSEQEVKILADAGRRAIQAGRMKPGSHSVGLTDHEVAADYLGGILMRSARDPQRALEYLKSRTSPSGQLLYRILSGEIVGRNVAAQQAAAQAAVQATAKAAQAASGRVMLAPAATYTGLVPGRINKLLQDQSLRAVEQAFAEIYSTGRAAGQEGLKAVLLQALQQKGSPVAQFIQQARAAVRRGETVSLGMWERSAHDSPKTMHQSDFARLLQQVISGGTGTTIDFSKPIAKATKAVQPEGGYIYQAYRSLGYGEEQALRLAQQHAYNVASLRKTAAAAAAVESPPISRFNLKAAMAQLRHAGYSQEALDTLISKYGLQEVSKLKTYYGKELSSLQFREPQIVQEKVAKTAEAIVDAGAKTAEQSIKKTNTAAQAAASPKIQQTVKRTLDDVERELLTAMGTTRQAGAQTIGNAILRGIWKTRQEGRVQQATIDRHAAEVAKYFGPGGVFAPPPGGVPPGGGGPGGTGGQGRVQPSPFTSGFVARWSIYMSGIAATLFVFQELNQFLRAGIQAGAKYEETLRGVARAVRMNADAYQEFRSATRADVAQGRPYDRLAEVFALMTQKHGLSLEEAMAKQGQAEALARVLGIKPKDAAEIVARDIFGIAKFYAPQIQQEESSAAAAMRRASGSLQNVMGNWFTEREPEMIRLLDALGAWVKENEPEIKSLLNALFELGKIVGELVGLLLKGAGAIARFIDENKILRTIAEGPQRGMQYVMQLEEQREAASGVVRKKLPPEIKAALAEAEVAVQPKQYAPLLPDDLESMAQFLYKNLNIAGPLLKIRAGKERPEAMSIWRKRLAASTPEAQAMFGGMADLVERFYEAQDWLIANQPVISALDQMQDMLKQAMPAGLQQKLLGLQVQQFRVKAGTQYGHLLPAGAVDQMAKFYETGLYLQQEKPYVAGMSELFRASGYTTERWLEFLRREAEHQAKIYFGGAKTTEGERFMRLQERAIKEMQEEPIIRAMTRETELTGRMPQRLVEILKRRLTARAEERIKGRPEAREYTEKSLAVELKKIDIEAYESRLETLRRYYSEAGRMTKQHYELEKQYIEDTTDLMVKSGAITEQEADRRKTIMRRNLESMIERPALDIYRRIYDELDVMSNKHYELELKNIRRTVESMRDVLGDNPLLRRYETRLRERLDISMARGVDPVKEYDKVMRAIYLTVKHRQEELSSSLIKTWSDAAADMDDAFKRGFFDMMDMRFKRLTDVAVSAANIIKRATYESIYGFVKSGISSMAIPFLEGFFGASTSTGMSPNTTFSGGQTFTDFMGLVKMASGGVLTEPVVGVGTISGRSYLLGENGPEAVTPLGSGHTVGGGGISVQVHNYSGTPVSVQQNPTPGGGRELEILIGQALTKDGPASRALQSVYGLSRVGIRR